MQRGISVLIILFGFVGCIDDYVGKESKKIEPLVYLQPSSKGAVIDTADFTFKWEKSIRNKEVDSLYYDFSFGKKKDTLLTIRFFNKFERTVKNMEDSTTYYWKVKEFNPKNFEYIYGDLDSIFVALKKEEPAK